jgi:predicted nucleic acid-binding Zn ribbon protein
MAFGKDPKPMNELLKEFMKKIPQQTELKRGMVLHLWPKVVGDQISANTKKLQFEGNRLIVTVSSEAWRYELHANRYSIAKKLNERVDSKVVKEIVVRT